MPPREEFKLEAANRCRALVQRPFQILEQQQQLETGQSRRRPQMETQAPEQCRPHRLKRALPPGLTLHRPQCATFDPYRPICCPLLIGSCPAIVIMCPKILNSSSNRVKRNDRPPLVNKELLDRVNCHQVCGKISFFFLKIDLLRRFVKGSSTNPLSRSLE